jgi:hypothetical protein
MECPNCGSLQITEAVVTETFAYGGGTIDAPAEQVETFQATFPVMTCTVCQFGWRDYRAEDAIDAAMKQYLESRKI